MSSWRSPPTELDVQFRAETTLDDVVVTQVQRNGDCCLHRVQRARDDKVVAEAMTRWASSAS